MKLTRIIYIFFLVSLFSPTVGITFALPQQADSLQTITQSEDTISKEQAPLHIPLKENLNKNENLKVATVLIGIFLLIWALIIIFYYRWAIRFYATNWGISDHEWRILYPEIYAAELRWWHKIFRWKLEAQIKYSKKRIRYYRELHDAGIEARRQKILTDNPDADCNVIFPFDPPTKNPHSEESFGLPKNTIRGTLALSILVLFILMEVVNFFTQINLEWHFEGLITALKMVLAFYFGSKAVDALKTTESNKRDIVISAAPQDTPAGPTPNKPDNKPQTPPEQEALPNEKPAMPSRKSKDRVANVIENLITKSAAEKQNDAQKEAENKQNDLAHRVLSLTASFETGCSYPDSFAVVTGNFDGQGISFGSLQWCIGQGSLQPLLKKMQLRHPDVMKNTLGEESYMEIDEMLQQSLEKQLEWAKSIQIKVNTDSGKTVWRVTKAWREKLAALGKTTEMIKIQVEAALNRYQIALENCKYYKVSSERAVALMFDINVQNGKVNRKGAGQRIFDDYATLSSALSEEEKEIEKLKIIAKRRAEVSSARWRQDVLSRKMTIAAGNGKVHGKEYDLASDYNIGMKTVVTA